MSAVILTIQAYDFPKESYSLPLKQEIETKPKVDPSFAYFSYNPALYAALPITTLVYATSIDYNLIAPTLAAGVSVLGFIYPHGIGYRKFLGHLAIDLSAHFYYLSGSIGAYFYTHPYGKNSFYFGTRESFSIFSYLASGSWLGMGQFSTGYSYKTGLNFPPPLVIGFQRNKDRKQFFQCSLYLDSYNKKRSRMIFFGKEAFYIGRPLFALEYGKSF